MRKQLAVSPRRPLPDCHVGEDLSGRCLTARRAVCRRFALSALLVLGCLSSGANAQEPPMQRQASGRPRSAAAAAAADEACAPSCRSGYACVRGQCVSKCNPVCGDGERCTNEGECVPAVVSSQAPPAPALSAGHSEPTETLTSAGSSNDLPNESSALAGVHRHDGFFLRLGAGPSLNLSGSGFGGAFEVALGGTIGRGIVVGAMSSPKVVHAVGFSADETAVFTFLGPFVDYYPDPSKGLHLLGGGGVASATFPGGKTNPAVSLELLAGAGYEWWVGNQWSIGLLGRISYLNPGGIESDIWGNSSLFLLNGMVSFTYH